MNKFNIGDVLARSVDSSNNIGLYIVTASNKDGLEMITLDYETREHAIGNLHVATFSDTNTHYEKIN